jgi:hypothetical protein
MNVDKRNETPKSKTILFMANGNKILKEKNSEVRDTQLLKKHNSDEQCKIYF